MRLAISSLVAASAWLAAIPAEAQGVSTICSLTNGAFAGKYFDFAPKPALPVDSACSDGQGNAGVVVPPPVAKIEKSTLCHFTTGSKRGTTHDYAPMAPLPVGLPCNDGVDSNGTVVSANR